MAYRLDLIYVAENFTEQEARGEIDALMQTCLGAFIYSVLICVLLCSHT